MESKNKEKIYLSKKKGHNDSIISISINNNELSHNIISTSSDDGTIRIWDLRKNSSIKLYSLKKENGEIGNAIFSNENDLISTKGKNIYVFDSRTDKIIVNEYKQCLKLNAESDDINQICIDKNGKNLAYCDDLGSISFINPNTYENICYLKQRHSNIAYSIDFIYKKDVPIAVSSGFDCFVNFWDLEKYYPLKSININEIAQKYITGSLLSPPLIYSIYAKNQSVLVSTENGHIYCLNYSELKKPKFIIDAHLGKIIRSVFCNFDSEKIVSVSNDLSWALWDTNSRDIYGVPIFIKRIEIENKPNWLETSKNNMIFIADTSSDLLLYEIKN